MKKYITQLAVVLFVLLLVGTFFHWTVNRYYVTKGHSLLLRYKGPLLFGSKNLAKPGYFAKENEIGVREVLRGPGRHFYCPIWWERILVDDQIVKPGQVAIVRSMLGDELPSGQFLVDGNLGETKHKGILRKAYGPGVYRTNPYAYEFKVVDVVEQKVGNQTKHSGWVNIPTGFVGVVTNLTDIPQKNQKTGIQLEVMQPGIYPINTKEQQIDIIKIGFRETSVVVKHSEGADGKVIIDETGEPVVKDNSSGINFPSNDGFPIQIDFTTIWGVMPEQAPEVIRTFGNVDAIEQKVILPQTESICRNHGSQYSAVELLVGEKRQQLQVETDAAFRQILSEKRLELQHGLIRHIYVPHDVRKPIQMKFISDELRQNRDQQQLTAEVEAQLREAEKEVDLEAERTIAETLKMYEESIALGNKKVGELKAETIKLVAAIDKDTASIESQATVLKGRAMANADKLEQEAKSQKFRLAVEAFGTGEAYTRWSFAQGLPEDVKLNFIHAGEGTFWTDLEGTTNKLIGKQLSETKTDDSK